MSKRDHLRLRGQINNKGINLFIVEINQQKLEYIRVSNIFSYFFFKNLKITHVEICSLVTCCTYDMIVELDFETQKKNYAQVNHSTFIKGLT